MMKETSSVYMGLAGIQHSAGVNLIPTTPLEYPVALQMMPTAMMRTAGLPLVSQLDQSQLGKSTQQLPQMHGACLLFLGSLSYMDGSSMYQHSAQDGAGGWVAARHAVDYGSSRSREASERESQLSATFIHAPQAVSAAVVAGEPADDLDQCHATNGLHNWPQ